MKVTFDDGVIMLVPENVGEAGVLAEQVQAGAVSIERRETRGRGVHFEYSVDIYLNTSEAVTNLKQTLAKTEQALAETKKLLGTCDAKLDDCGNY